MGLQVAMAGEPGRNFRNVHPEHGFGVIRGLSSPVGSPPRASRWFL